MFHPQVTRENNINDNALSMLFYRIMLLIYFSTSNLLSKKQPASKERDSFLTLASSGDFSWLIFILRNWEKKKGEIGKW